MVVRDYIIQDFEARERKLDFILNAVGSRWTVLTREMTWSDLHLKMIALTDTLITK